MADLSDDITQMCGRLAAALWKNAHPSTTCFDQQDLRQEALCAAWTQLQLDPDTPNGLLYTIVRRRVIDWMRTVHRIGHRNAAGVYAYQPPVSLDEALGSGEDNRLNLTPDAYATEAFDHVDARFDFDQAFAAYRGPARCSEVVYLHSQGFTLAQIGEHFGVTEGRICQLKARFINEVARAWGTPVNRRSAA